MVAAGAVPGVDDRRFARTEKRKSQSKLQLVFVAFDRPGHAAGSDGGSRSVLTQYSACRKIGSAGNSTSR
jgi:hypothetical protein